MQILKTKNILLGLVVVFVLALNSPSLLATEFDNSQFVSELTSEEQAAIELEKAETDYDEYAETVSLRPGYKNFSGFTYYETEEAFNAALKSTYDQMDQNPDYSAEQKNEYYNLMIGSDVEPGLMRQIQEFYLVIKEYNENESVVVDCTEALAIIEQFESPKLSIDNVEYIMSVSQLLIDVQDAFKVVPNSSLSEEELKIARDSNALFTSKLKAIIAQVPSLSFPKLSIMKRISHQEVIFNIGMLVAILILFAVRFPVVKKQQEYVWNKFRPLTMMSIPIVGMFFFIFFTWFFSMPVPAFNGAYSIYIDGQSVSASDRIYQTAEQKHIVTLVSNGSDNTQSNVSFELFVTSDASVVPTTGDLRESGYGKLGKVTFEKTESANQVVLPVSDDKFQYTTVGGVISTLGITSSDNFEPDSTLLQYYTNWSRNQFILPMNIRLIIPSLLFGVLFFMYIQMPGKMVKTYLDELYTINKFCGFLSYNMAYRSNARVLIEETLQSLDQCKFAEDFAIIFFEKNRNMTDKIQDISQIYSYKFFEMYLGIVNIIFDEGVSDSTLKSLSIIQQFGDEYYNQADMFFKSKQGARTALMMIIAICVVLPCIVKNKVGDMFSLYMTMPNGYTMTIGSYLVWFGLICVIYNMYKDNKIVRAEGRYV